MFSWQQELSDKMMCNSAKHVMKKYEMENSALFTNQIANRELEVEKMKEGENEGKKKENKEKSTSYSDAFEKSTGLKSMTETCRMFGFPHL